MDATSVSTTLQDMNAPTTLAPSPSSFNFVLCAFELQYLINLDNHQFARHLDTFTRSTVSLVTSSSPGRSLVTPDPEWSRNQHSFKEHLRLLSKALTERALKPLDSPYVKLQEGEFNKIADTIADKIKSRSQELSWFRDERPSPPVVTEVIRIKRPHASHA